MGATGDLSQPLPRRYITVPRTTTPGPLYTSPWKPAFNTMLERESDAYLTEDDATITDRPPRMILASSPTNRHVAVRGLVALIGFGP